MNQARNRTAGKTLFMRIASDLYKKARRFLVTDSLQIKPSGSGDKNGPAHVIRPLLWLVMSRSLHVKAYIHTYFIVTTPPPPPAQRGFSGTMIILHYLL